MERLEGLEDVARRIRGRLNGAFALDTATPGTAWDPPSAGHCAAVALIVQAALGGDLASTIYRGESHWFNRFATERGSVDVDLTGDQFGLKPVRVSDTGELFPTTRLRDMAEVLDETIDRAVVLATRAGLADVARSLVAELERRRPADRSTASA